MAETSHKRYIKNFIVFPLMQTRMSYYFVAFALCLVGVMMVLLNHYLGEIRNIMIASPGLSMVTQKLIEDDLSSLMMTSFAVLFVALIVSVVYGIIISHRIAGPMFGIIKYIEALRAGDTGEPRKLRPYDELLPIMAALHGLADDMKKKKGA